MSPPKVSLGAVFTELFFIMSSIWQHQFYYLFGFLMLVIVILVVTCAEISMTLTYFQLTNEDYTWFWRSFFASASSGLYVFGYAILYYYTRMQCKGTQIESKWWLGSFLVYFRAEIWFSPNSGPKIDQKDP